MTETPGRSDAMAAWLREVERMTRELPSPYRDEVLAGLQEHLDDARDAGVDEGAALARLGAASEVAADAVRQYRQGTGEARPSYLTAKRWVQIIALVLAAAGSLAAALLPSYTRATVTSEGLESITSLTLLEVNGPTALIPLAIPVLLAALPLFTPRRGWQAASVVSAVLLVLFTAVAMFSLGTFYPPAAIVAIVGACLPTARRA